MDTLLWSDKSIDGATTTYDNSARNYLYWAEGSFGGVAYKNYIHIFAFEGDTICFGSDICDSQLNAAGTANATEADKADIAERLGTGATVDIVLTDLQGNRILYDVVQDGKGHIPNVQTEVLAKTMESPEGQTKADNTGKSYTYTPLTYTVQETGVYTIEFHSSEFTAANTVGSHRYGQTTKNDTVGNATYNVQRNFYRPEMNSNTAEPTPSQRSALVAAWDVSVFNEQGHKETGRVYADYLSMQMNGSYQVMESYYVVTTDSYIYRWDWLGDTPNTYNFFADNKGLTDNATGSTLYKSVKELTNANFDYTRFGASFKYPGSANTDESKSYYIFFEMPDSDLEGHLYTRAIQPDPAENIRFVDEVYDEVQKKNVPGSYEGLGGYFAFDTKEATTATLVLKFDQIEIGGQPVGTYAPVTISGPVKPYDTNHFYWDGRDGNGKVIPEGNYKIEDLIELTTKAGEIHFPVHDMEFAPGGFTFTRVSPIYNREGEQVDGPNTILDATKSVIYYDDSAIYYGEKVGSTGLTEMNVRPENTNEQKTLRDLHATTHVINDQNGGTYYKYNNMENDKGGEYLVRSACQNYVGGVTEKDANVDSENFIRIGDHSHTTNMIQYYNDDGTFLKTGDPKYQAQEQMINYLDSDKYPVAKVPTWTTSGTNYGDTTDYGIADFWTFIPAQPAVVEDNEQIIEILGGEAFNLTGQVFYDKDESGDYDSMADSDTLLEGVTLNLYRKTADASRVDGKTYYTLTTADKVNPDDTGDASHSVLQVYMGAVNSGGEYYECIKTGVTPVSGRYFFTNIPYSNGDTFVYEVVRPNASYALTSGNTKAEAHHSATGSSATASSTGAYALYAYDSAAFGTEVQKLTVGTGSDRIDPNSKGNHTITAVDVGYHYDLNTKLTLKKTWSADASTTLPEPAVFEVCYVDSTGNTHLYEERPLPEIEKLENTYELLPAEMEGHTVRDWYVAAEYYIATVDGTSYLFKHTFAYDTTTGTYSSFVGQAYYLCDTEGSAVTVQTEANIPDADHDGTNSWDDLYALSTDPEYTWQPAIGMEGSVSTPFHAVLDRDPGSAEITISITNTDKSGVLEVLKYTGALTDESYLQGATFRLYAPEDEEDANPETFLTTVETYIQQTTAEDEATRTAAFDWLDERQVDSNSTRANGKVAFAGLDPDKHYVLREVYPPMGYRSIDDVFLIHPDDCEDYKTTRDTATLEEEWEQYQRQNFRFGADAFVQAAIANAPVNGDMAIRKQIDGRAWNNNDSFTFDISFRDADGNVIGDPENSITSLGDLAFFKLEDELYDGDLAKQQELMPKFKSFIVAFNGQNTDITINNLSEQAKNVVTLVDGQKIEKQLADTKQSVPLIVNDEVKYDSDGSEISADLDDAQLNTSGNGGAGGTTTMPEKTPHPFPAAGTYTFTVSENPVAGDSTLESSPRVYTMVVKVTRTLNPGAGAGAQMTEDNTYLRAEVQDIVYCEPVEGTADSPEYPADYGSRQVFAGVAPTFTNTYHVQPAIQTTSYAITKEFTGRLDTDGQLINSSDNQNGADDPSRYNDGWLPGDRFYVTITGADQETRDALTAGNIYIGGLHGARDTAGKFDTNKAVSFNQINVTNPRGTTDDDDGNIVDDGHTFNFEEIDFQNLKFPVRWEFTANHDPYTMGSTVPEDDNDQTNEVIYIEDGQVPGVDAGYYFVAQVESEYTEEDLHPVTARTEDIVYTLEIREYAPAETKGIDYDEAVYTLVITLKNAVNADPTHLNETVTDGIVDELNFALYDCAAEDLEDDPERTPMATCETDQQLVNSFGDWASPSFEEFDTAAGIDWKTKWYYVNNSTGDDHPVIREAEVVASDIDGVPTEFKVMVPGSSGESEIHIVETKEASAGSNYFTFDELTGTGYDITFIAKREGHTGSHTMTFSNTYQATGTWTPTINKTVTGRNWQEGESFTFELTCTKWPGMGEADSPNYTYDPLKKEGVDEAEKKTLTINKGTSGNENSDSFGGITFHAPGEYIFTISETDAGMGVGHGDTRGEITIKVTAEDNGDGTLTLKVTGDGGTVPEDDLGADSNAVVSTVNFVNAYSEDGTFQIAIEKTLTGRAWNEDESFTFTVTPDEAAKQAIQESKLSVPVTWIDAGGGESYTVTVKEDADRTGKGIIEGILELKDLEAVGAKYEFTVKENTSGLENIYCVQPEIKLTVTAYSGTKEDGSYTGAVLTYAYLGDDTETQIKTQPYTVPFVNRYYVDTDAPTTGIGEHGFTVAKDFTGRPSDAWNTGDTFTAHVAFDAAESSGGLDDFGYKSGGDYVKWSDSEYGTAEFTADHHSKKDFDFRFFEVGNYVFTVSEDEGSIAGVRYDTNSYTVTFNVTLNSENKLEVQRTITGGEAENVSGGAITFKNTYVATGKWTPTVTKTLNERFWQSNEHFDFTLTCTSVPDGVTNPIPDGKTISIGEDDAESGISFDEIIFTKPGEYHFTITENGKGAGLGTGGTTPAGSITLAVKAEDNEDGTLNLKVTGDGGTTIDDGSSEVSTTVTFVNTYNESGSLALSLSKLLTGRDWRTDDVFTFTVTPDSTAKAAIDAGKLTVPSHWVGTSDGYTVTVNEAVSDETVNADGWVTKTLSMDTLQVGNLQVGNLQTEGSTAQTVYGFTITENTTDFAGKQLTCAQPSLTLTVTVTPNLETGVDSVTATYAYLDSGEVPVTGALPFVNRYYASAEPESTGSSLVIGKRLTGRNWLSDESYTVNVALTSGEANEVQYDSGDGVYAVLPKGNTLSHSFQGNGSEDPGDWTLNFRFYEVGTYVFTVREQEPDSAAKKPGVVCDTAKYTATFTVTKKRDTGQLIVSRAVTADTAEKTPDDGKIVFTNTYTPTPAIWTPTVIKMLNGREWVPEDSFLFVFAVEKDVKGEDPAGVKISMPDTVTVTGAGDNKASFGQVTFTEAGTYNFTITETVPADIGIEASDAGKYTLTATVTDHPETGELSVAIAPQSGEAIASGENITTTTTFVNTYKVESATFKLALEKTLVGREWQSGESFTFTVTPETDYGDALSYPAGWPSGGSAYTCSLSNDGSSAVGGVLTKELGEITVNRPGQYVFTVRETGAADDTHCLEPEIVLTVSAEAIMEGDVPGDIMQVTTTYAYSDGSIIGGDAGDGTTTIPFVNHAFADATLMVTKTLDGRDMVDGEFSAEIKLASASPVGGGDGNRKVICDGTPMNVDGVKNVPLKKAGSSVPLRFLAEGTYTFDVTELRGSAPRVTYDDSKYMVTVTVAPDDDGVLKAQTEIRKDGAMVSEGIHFVNTYREPSPTPPTPSDEQYGNLVVTKTVTGDEGERDREWHFRVELGDTEIDGQFGDMLFQDGVAEFTLRHGQRKTARDLPAGVTYAVTEREENQDGYATTFTDDRGTIVSEQDMVAAFLNDKPAPAKPDDPEDPDNPDHPGRTPDDPGGTPDDPDHSGGTQDNPDHSGGTTDNPDQPGRIPVHPSDSSYNTDGLRKDAVDTGDHSQPGLWMTFTIFSLTGIALAMRALFKDRKRR